MEKEIKIDISSREDLLEKYNESKVCKDVIAYLVKEAMLVDKETTIKIVVNKDSAVLNSDCIELIKNGLKDEYKRSMAKQHSDNVKQIYFSIIGVFLIFLATILKNVGILKDVILVVGGVPIWETIRIELFPDAQGRVKRRVLRKLMQSEIVERI